MLILDLQKENGCYQAKLAVERKRNTHFAPFNLFYAFALGTANQRCKHQSFMEAKIPKKCCCRAILHRLYNFSNMGGFNCAPRSLYKLYSSSTGQEKYKKYMRNRINKKTNLQISSTLLASPVMRLTVIAASLMASGAITT
jgi:hypothetical protein